MEREGTLVIHFSTFGKQSQAVKAAAEMVKTLQVRGATIVSALYNREELNVE